MNIHITSLRQKKENTRYRIFDIISLYTFLDNTQLTFSLMIWLILPTIIYYRIIIVDITNITILY